MKHLLLILMGFFVCANVMAAEFDLPAAGNVVGELHFAQVKSDDTYATIAERYDTGYYNLFEANPGVNADNPAPGTILIIPTRYVLPPELHNNIVINLAELRLYYESDKLHEVFVYPIGIGREGWNTPLGKYKIAQKQKNPYWTVPESIRKYREEQGDPVPKVVPPGPKNPLGIRAMRLSQPDYLIHGTDDPVGIGRRSSAGCIRMYNQDVEQLFDMVALGTQVVIINEPYKVGFETSKVYLEAHMPLSEQRDNQKNFNLVLAATAYISALYVPIIKQSNVLKIINNHLGIPEIVGTKFLSS